MEKHRILTDEEFLRQISEASLPPSAFTHEAHLRLAWLHLEKYDLYQAIDRVRQQLVNYVAKLGVSGKYHETLTVASVQVINHFRAKSQAEGFPGFMEEFPQLKSRFRALLACHYGHDLMNSPEARRTYQEPDLLPF